MSPEELLSLGLSKELVVIAISALPVAELRGGLPLAINFFHFPWYYALLLAIIGNLLPVPLLLLLFSPLSQIMSRIKILERMLNWLSKRVKKRGSLIEKYQQIGLMLFVAVPLPLTGAWTGSIAAVLFGLKFKQAFLAILLGIFIASIIVTCLCLLGWVGAVIAGVGLGALATFGLWKV